MWPLARRENKAILLILALALSGSLLTLARLAATPAEAAPVGQAATETQPANRIEVLDTGEGDVNVRSGPGTDYVLVGVLVAGQTSTITGRNPEGTWFEIEYIGGPGGVGWVFKDLVHVVGDINTMPTIVPPPTPTLPPTTTPAPGETASTLFDSTATPIVNRLPTFTAPAVALLPTLLPAQGLSSGGAFPPAVLIIVLFVLGTLGILLSLLRLRQ